MSHLEIHLGLVAVIINVIFRIITAIVFLAFLFPLFIKEAKVKNGLRLLRFELLFTGTIIFLVNTLGLVIIVFRYANYDTRLVSEVVTYFNTFSLLVYALVKYKIYTFKYAPENKKLHEKLEKIEIRERQKAKRLTTNKKVK